MMSRENLKSSRDMRFEGVRRAELLQVQALM
jgi:hypothetical protein